MFFFRNDKHDVLLGSFGSWHVFVCTFSMLLCFASCVPAHLQENTPVPQLIEQLYGRQRTYVEEVVLGEEMFTVESENDADTAVYVTYSRPILLENQPVTLTLILRYIGNLSMGGEAHITGGEGCTLSVLRPTYLSWSELMWKRFYNSDVIWSGVVEYSFGYAMAAFYLPADSAKSVRKDYKSILQNTDSVLTAGEVVSRDASRRDTYTLCVSSFDAESRDTLSSYHLSYYR